MGMNERTANTAPSPKRRRPGKRLDASVSVLVPGNQSLQEVLERSGIVTVRQLWDANGEELIKIPGLTRADMYVLAKALMSWLHSRRPAWYDRIPDNSLIAVFEY